MAFTSDATNLVTGDTNTHTDIFLRDRQTGTTARINVVPTIQANQASWGPSISADLYVLDRE